MGKFPWDISNNHHHPVLEQLHPLNKTPLAVYIFALHFPVPQPQATTHLLSAPLGLESNVASCAWLHSLRMFLRLIHVSVICSFLLLNISHLSIHQLAEFPAASSVSPTHFYDRVVAYGSCFECSFLELQVAKCCVQLQNTISDTSAPSVNSDSPQPPIQWVLTKLAFKGP